MAEAGADWFFEMRNKAGEFAVGPFVRWQEGRLLAQHDGSQPLIDVAAGQWVRIEIEARTASKEYDVSVTRLDGQKREWKKLPCQSSWDGVSMLLFSGTGTKQAAIFVDNFLVERIE